MTLTDSLKVLLGRKLSVAQIELSKNGKEEHPACIIAPDYFEGNFDNLYRDGKSIFRVIIEYQLATTPDASLGSRCLHTNYYSVKDDIRVYNQEGLLLERTVSQNIPFGSLISHKESVFNPAGKLIGKKIRK